MTDTPATTEPDPAQWKSDYLDLEHAIAEFRTKYPVFDQNVSRLLHYHLSRAAEFLYAEVNGGLNEMYQAEIDGLPSEDVQDAEQP